MASARPAVFALLAMAPSAAGAVAGCPQAQAVYNAAEAGAEIAFSGKPDDVDAMQHRFSLIFAENGVTMEGVVMMAGEPDRPWGMVLHDCPEGDATGAEIAACTVWQGVIYGLDAAGGAAWLPVSADGAAEGLLLPDFSAALMRSAAWSANRITTLPGDVFRLTGCQE